MPVQEPRSLFLHPLHRVFSCPLRQAQSGFFDNRSVLLYPSFTHKRSTIGVQNSAFDFSGRWSTEFFWQCSEKVLESTEKTTNAKNRILSFETDELEPWEAPPFHLLSTGRCIHCVPVHCLVSSQRSMTSPRKGTTSFPSTKTERAVQGLPHNACIPQLNKLPGPIPHVSWQHSSSLTHSLTHSLSLSLSLSLSPSLLSASICPISLCLSHPQIHISIAFFLWCPRTSLLLFICKYM